MLELNNTTLLGVDCIDIDRLIYAAEVSQKNIKFQSVKLLTSIDLDYPNIIKIDAITSIEDYSKFMIRELVKYVETDYVLIIQYDGYVLNHKSWDNEFFEYDYIGSPCLWGMGNGGFSLRSRKLLLILSKEASITEYNPEDLKICKTYKPILEAKGIKYAPFELASRFGVENNIWNNQFGFHNADISLWDIDNNTNSKKHAKYIEKFKEKYKYSEIRLTYIVHFYLEDNQYDPIQELIDIYSSYDKNIMNKIHFVFVDDHSKVQIKIAKKTHLNYTLIHIKDNIRWNQSGARNIGAKHARSENMILTDLDIVFPENLLSNLVYFFPPNNSIFKFNTISSLKEVESHFNVFFLSKDTFFKTNGVDEAFSGNYGYEDVFFYFLQKKMGTKFYRYRQHNIVHKEHKNSKEKQHNSLIRDMTINKALFDEKIKIMELSDNPLDSRSQLFLNFTWEIVQESNLSLNSKK